LMEMFNGSASCFCSNAKKGIINFHCEMSDIKLTAASKRQIQLKHK